VLSFAGINRRVGTPEVRATLLQALEDRHGRDDIPPSRAELIDEFHETFKEIDQDAYKRLRHFRNPEKMLKSITLVELGALIAIISRLATTLQQLCQVPSAFRWDMLDEYRELAKRTIKP
jgi:hypothetical protein